MSAKTTRRSTRLAIDKEIKKEEDDSSSSQYEDDDEDDLPPPILEREINCSENGDSDGSGKEAENRDSKTPEVIEEPYEDANSTEKGTDLLQALSHVFSAGSSDSSFADPFPRPVGRPRKNPEPTFEFVPLMKNGLVGAPGKTGLRTGGTTKAMVLKPHPGPRPLMSSSTPSTSSGGPNRFTPLRQHSTSLSGGPLRRGPFGAPPPLPQALRAPMTGVGSNTSIGPARLLENRKRPAMSFHEKDKEAKRSLLVAYNGGRAGEKFRGTGTSGSLSGSSGILSTPLSSGPSSSGSSGASGASSSTSSAIDAVSMLSEQSPVQIQVTAGADRDLESVAVQETFEMAVLQKDAIGNVAKQASNHNVLLGSMIINGLTTLQTRNPDDYQAMTSDLYALFSKYRIH